MKKLTLFTLLMIAVAVNSSLTATSLCQTSDAEIDSLLQLADNRFNQMKEKEALNIYLEILNRDPNNYTALWNTSLLFAREGYRSEDEDVKRELYKRSHYYAEKAVLSYPDSVHSHYVYSVANGRFSDIARKKERIRKSHIIKEHIDKAVLLDPDFAPAWHLYGVWHSTVANIGNAEKLAANLISGGIPSGASHERAEKYLQKAIELDPDQILFRLDLAKHYKNAGQKDKAIEVLKKVLEMEPRLQDDAKHLKNAQHLLNQLQNS